MVRVKFGAFVSNSKAFSPMTKSTPPSRSTRRAGGAASSPWPWPVILISAGALLLVGIVAFATYQTVQQRTARTAAIEGVQTYPGEARGHTESAVKYDVEPPVGGQHNPNWLNCGIYDQAVPNENAVHALEHGAVWVTYRPDLTPDQVSQLRALVKGRDYAILSPYPNLPAPVVASAWGLQLRLDNPGDERLSRFLIKYMQGPQTPEPGAVCYGGVGTPVQQ